MSKPDREEIFEWAVIGDHPSRQTVARFRCAKCRTQTLDIVRGAARTPQFFCQKARDAGWECDSHRASSNVCPDCIAARKEVRRGESWKKPAPLPTPAILRPVVMAPRPADTPVVVKLDGVAMTPQEMAAAVRPDEQGEAVSLPIKHEATIDEKRAIRALLDANFDERGFYVSDYSDERIARECRVPRIVVTDIRERAYGVLREPPEVLALRERMNVIADRLAQREDALKELSKKFELFQTETSALKGTMAALDADIKALTGKLGIK